MWEPIQVLDIFYKANLKREDKSIIYREFYNDTINNNVKLEDQYEEWLSQKKQMEDPNCSYVNIQNLIHYHWILDTQSKNEILFFDSRMKMGGEIDNEIIRNFAFNPFQI